MSNTNPHETYLRKGPYGWRATSSVDIAGGRTLEVTTRKRTNSNALVTYVSAGRVDGSFFTHLMYEDYCKCHAATIARCTEKAVASLHADVMANIDSIVADVVAFYAAKEVAA